MLPQKILAICEWGNSRSVALAWLLKEQYHKDALACGICVVGPDTFKMLYDWAEMVIVTDARLTHPYFEQYSYKTEFWDVGPDVYFRGFDPDLIEQYRRYLKDT